MRDLLAGVRLWLRGAAPLLILAVAAGCDSENLYQQLPTAGGGARDASVPEVRILRPDSAVRVGVQDSVLVEFRVTDKQALQAVELSGFALRGRRDLGTATRVERFASKTVEFDSTAVVRDTTLRRFLIATSDTVPDDSVFVVVNALDRSGNSRADTVRLSIGGPRVRLLSPAAGADVRAGTSVRVRVAASDARSRVEQITVRAMGPTPVQSTLMLDPSLTAVDTVVTLALPSGITGDYQLQAQVRTASNDSALTASVPVRVLAPIQDRSPPTVTFSVEVPRRMERDDSVRIRVAATDSTQVSHVGVVVVATHRLAGRTDALSVVVDSVAGEQGLFGFSLDALGVPVPVDTSTVRIEVTAFARDTASNCGTSSIPATPLSERCDLTRLPSRAIRPGARFETLVMRGITIALAGEADQVADIASDGQRVFLSNVTRNRLDVLRVGEHRLSGTVSVGSRPWGLAFNRDRSRLYVANSGGTNISVVAPSSMSEVRRIQTPNIKLYGVNFEAVRVPNPDTTRTDSVTRLYPSALTGYDFSDRPQFIGVTANENLVYSTRPTSAARDGTVRFYRMDQERLELVTEYAEQEVAGKLIILNADSVKLVVSQPKNLLRVCPRRRSTDPALEPALPAGCAPDGTIEEVIAWLERYRFDTEVRFNVDASEIGLADTTFVATSGDHSTVAVGEGARQNGRIMVFTDVFGQLPSDPLRKSGEIRDIVGNTADRVIGLALNGDGSLGVARGREAYYFSRNLRLQGTVGTGTPSGGVDMSPQGQRFSFVSGLEDNGLAYIDVIDTLHFRRVARMFMRDPVTGALRVVPAANGALLVYAVTDRGVVALEVNAGDTRPAS